MKFRVIPLFKGLSKNSGYSGKIADYRLNQPRRQSPDQLAYQESRNLCNVSIWLTTHSPPENMECDHQFDGLK